jgi:hypothetical protein
VGTWIGTLNQSTRGQRGYTSFMFLISIGVMGNQITGTTRSDSPDNLTHYVTFFKDARYGPPVLTYHGYGPRLRRAGIRVVHQAGYADALG